MSKNGEENIIADLYEKKHETASLPNISSSEGEEVQEVPKVDEDKITPVIAKADKQAEEGGTFKGLRKAINLANTPARKQRLQNRLNKLELKSGGKAEELKAKGEKQIAKMKYGKKGAEAGMAKEKADEEKKLASEKMEKSQKGKWDLAEKEAKLNELDRQWRSDLPTSQKGSSYFQSTRPKPSLNVKGLGTDYYKDRYATETNPNAYKPSEDLSQESRWQQALGNELFDKPEFSIAPGAHKFDTSPLNISLTTPIRQAKRDSKFKNIAQGLNK